MRLRAALGMLCVTVAAVGGCVHNLPPAERLMHPGPGVGGPGPGVLPPAIPMPAIAAPVTTVQLLYDEPQGMHVHWDVGAVGMYDSEPLITPGRYNFPEGGVYRLKLTNIDGRPGVELYPTIEIGPTTPRSAAYLEHNAIPIQFVDEDFDQVLTGNFVTKVIYLPDPEFQELALAGVKTLVSTRLDPGIDPIVEADRRGAILAIIRMGNKDMQMPGAIPAGGFGPGGFAPGGFAPGGFPGEVIPLGEGAPYGSAQNSDDENPGAAAAAGVAQAQFTAPVSDGGPVAAAPSVLNDANVAPAAHNDYGPLPGSNYGAHGYVTGATPMALAPGQGAVPPYIAGVNAPPWGMASSGTPIGLPGPPHIPFGSPAGLRRHTMRNWTLQRLPRPNRRITIGVKHSPGYSYPQPGNNMWVHERTYHRVPLFRQPVANRVQYGNSYSPYGHH